MTGPDGLYYFIVSPTGTYPVAVQIPTGTQPSPANVGAMTRVDSDGVSGHLRVQCRAGECREQPATPTPISGSTTANDSSRAPARRATGRTTRRRGRSPASRSAASTYTKAQAIAWLGKVGKDKTTTMFSSLVPAMLNVLIGNDSSCVSQHDHGGQRVDGRLRPVGSNVGGVEPRVDGRRTAAPADGRLQQRPALRPASESIAVARWPSRRVTGHRSTLSERIADIRQHPAPVENAQPRHQRHGADDFRGPSAYRLLPRGSWCVRRRSSRRTSR